MHKGVVQLYRIISSSKAYDPILVVDYIIVICEIVFEEGELQGLCPESLVKVLLVGDEEE